MARRKNLNLVADLVQTLTKATDSNRGTQTAARKRKSNKAANRRTYDNVQVPAAMGVIHRYQAPTYTVRDGMTVINNTEALLVVNTGVAGAFTQSRTALIPGNFNWLFRIASSWQKYRVRNMCVVYTPVCSTSLSGEVILAVTYDRRDLSAGTMLDAATIFRSVSSPIWGGFDGLNHIKPGPFKKAGPGVVCTDVDTSHLTQPYYIFATTSSFNLMSTTDQNVYCPASLDVYTNGGPAAATEVGKVWIHYEIELIDPITSNVNA